MGGGIPEDLIMTRYIQRSSTDYGLGRAADETE